MPHAHLKLHQPLPDGAESGRLHAGTVPGPADPATLAAMELLRPAPKLGTPSRDSERELAPFSRAWYEEIEQKRYAGAGHWLRRVLGFSRHANDSLLMIAPGLGSDAVQYDRHGTRVVAAIAPWEDPSAAARNFALRGLAIPTVALRDPSLKQLPFRDGQFDLVSVNLLGAPELDLAAASDELYRVLKPGGKLFALAPARFDATYWARLAMPWRHFYRSTPKFGSAPRHSSSSLKRAFAGFEEARVLKRHLRANELPYAWRFVPPSWSERVLGRVMVYRGFKPVSAAYLQMPAAA